ncbi:MAG: hypothetical protein P8P99_05675 [Maricaulis sp.]|nr:hypothetical protein [Maricaulis sp.]
MRGWAQLGVMRCLFVMIAALLTAGCVGVPPHEEVPLVTIAEIHEDPWAWDGRRVRVLGHFGLCMSPDCGVCDDFASIQEQNPDFLFPRRGHQACAITSMKSPAMADLLSFSTATFVATYNARCSTDTLVLGAEVLGAVTINPDGNYITELIGCGFSEGEFVGATAFDILETRSASSVARDGLTEVLQSATEPERSQIYEALVRAADPDWEDYMGDEAYEIYADIYSSVQDFRPPFVESAVCFCEEDECLNADWPTRLFHLRPAAGNPYFCYYLRQRPDGSWFFPLQ